MQQPHVEFRCSNEDRRARMSVHVEMKVDNPGKKNFLVNFE